MQDDSRREKSARSRYSVWGDAVDHTCDTCDANENWSNTVILFI